MTVPFDTHATDEQLDDLRRRLRATRWPDAPEQAGWSLGTDLDYLRELVDYWAEGFDWRAQEAKLATLTRFAHDGIHFVHERRGAFPLVLTHGWPDSFWRYTKVIPLLTDPPDPADAFDVIVPDMPGYGYSATPAQPLNSRDVAALWAELMTELGYERFGAAGGDIGSHVSRYLALDHPERVVAVHRTDAGIPRGLPDDATPAEAEWMRAGAEWAANEGAYSALHRTKPQTAAFGLSDSPVGLAAWLVEKMHGWSDPATDYTFDEILTNVTIYWFTGTIGSSMRMYAANAQLPPEQLARRVEVPSGFSLFPGDILTPPRDWLERSSNLQRVTYPEHGGHFAAFEQPELYAQELRDFFRPYRQT